MLDLDALDFAKGGGLVTVVTQDADSGAVLMVAHADREALERTVATGEVHYWSRSRAMLWHKGEQSGHVQRVREVRLDCDGDAILLVVEPQGGVACHTGRERCFYRRLHDGEWQTVDPVIEDPATVYGHD